MRSLFSNGHFEFGRLRRDAKRISSEIPIVRAYEYLSVLDLVPDYRLLKIKHGHHGGKTQ